MVLVLLSRGAMAVQPPTWLALLMLAFGLGLAAPAGATERTFLFSPADLAVVIDEFNAHLIEHSASFGKTLSVKNGIVKLAKNGCPTLAGDPQRRLTRVRVLDSAERAGVLAGKRTANLVLGTALANMGAMTWSSPSTGRVGRPTWLIEAATPGILGFATVGYANGTGTGAVDSASRNDTKASLLVRVDMPPFAPDSTDLVLAVTTELPPRRPGGVWKRSECYVLARRESADVKVLVDLVAAAELADITRNRLNNILADVLTWAAQQDWDRAARNLRIFSIEVANRSGGEIPIDTADELLARTLTVSEALGF